MCACVHRCIYTLHDFPIAKFQGCILMNVKLWGKCLGTGEKMRQKSEKLTLFEWASQLKVDAEFHRKNQVGSWPRARTAASAPCESVYTPRAHINSHPAGPAGLPLRSITSWLITCLQDRRMDLRKHQHACCLQGGTQ